MLKPRYFFLLISFITLALLYFLRPILTPFILGALLAYLANPSVEFLQRYLKSRTLTVSFVFIILSFIVLFSILFLIPILIEQLQQFLSKLPHYINWIKDKTAPLFEHFLEEGQNIDQNFIQQFLRDRLSQASGISQKISNYLWQSINSLINLLSLLFLTPLVCFYLMRDWHQILNNIKKLIPIPQQNTIFTLSKKCDQMLGAFLKGQLSVMLMLGILYSLGLSLIGLEMSIAIGLFSGFLSFIPYLGLIVGMSTSIIVAFVQFQDWTHPLLVCVVFTIVQSLESSVITPKLVGDRIGLHPLAVIFALLAGGQLFGFFGILIALPAAAVLNVFLNHFKTCYLNSRFYNPISTTLPKEQYINHEKAN